MFIKALKYNSNEIIYINVNCIVDLCLDEDRPNRYIAVLTTGRVVDIFEKDFLHLTGLDKELENKEVDAD